MQQYSMEAKSRADLRSLARSLRHELSIEDKLCVPIVELLDVFSEIFPNFSYEIVPDNDLAPDIHAETDILTGHITIKESVYEGACKGAGRDRMTIAHEIGHFFTICCCGFKMQRIFGNRKVKAYNDPEWQAKCFAAEFMIDYELTKDMSPRQIVDECGVTPQAAAYQSRHRGKGVVK